MSERQRANDTRVLRARGQRTRARLLDAGVEVFATRGYHSARVDDIVKVAETSHGTFYLYFANKEELFAALARDAEQSLVALAESLGPIDAGDAGRAELARWIGEFVAIYARYGSVIQAWTEAATSDGAPDRPGTDLLAPLATAVAGAIRAAGRADGLDPDTAGLALVAMIERFNYFALVGAGDAGVGSPSTTIDAPTIDALTTVTQSALFGAQT